MRSHSCSKCQESMTEGFIVDASHGTQSVSRWVEGVPEKSLWTGIKLRGKTSHEVQTWRCGRCGFLENYARG